MSETVEEARRSSIFDGLLTRDKLKQETGWCDRTVMKFEGMGLPFMNVAGKRYYAVEDVRVWVLKQRQASAPPPRAPGRPRKAAQAIRAAAVLLAVVTATGPAVAQTGLPDANTVSAAVVTCGTVSVPFGDDRRAFNRIRTPLYYQTSGGDTVLAPRVCFDFRKNTVATPGYPSTCFEPGSTIFFAGGKTSCVVGADFSPVPIIVTFPSEVAK